MYMILLCEWIETAKRAHRESERLAVNLLDLGAQLQLVLGMHNCGSSVEHFAFCVCVLRSYINHVLLLLFCEIFCESLAEK